MGTTQHAGEIPTMQGTLEKRVIPEVQVAERRECVNVQHQPDEQIPTVRVFGEERESPGGQVVEQRENVLERQHAEQFPTVQDTLGERVIPEVQVAEQRESVNVLCQPVEQILQAVEGVPVQRLPLERIPHKESCKKVFWDLGDEIKKQVPKARRKAFATALKDENFGPRLGQAVYWAEMDLLLRDLQNLASKWGIVFEDGVPVHRKVPKHRNAAL